MKKKTRINIAFLAVVLSLAGSLQAVVKPAMTAFNAGELGPMMRWRIGFDKWDNGCTTLQNMLSKEIGVKEGGIRLLLGSTSNSEKDEIRADFQTGAPPKIGP